MSWLLLSLLYNEIIFAWLANWLNEQMFSTGWKMLIYCGKTILHKILFFESCMYYLFKRISPNSFKINVEKVLLFLFKLQTVAR